MRVNVLECTYVLMYVCVYVSVCVYVLDALCECVTCV